MFYWENMVKFAKEIINFLLFKNIKTVFSYPGEQILPLYKELNENSAVKNIMVRCESGAAHMADGYSRITNSIGVCLATAGPGATNLLTGIATAYKDNSSILAITGRCKKEFINKNYFQELKMDFLNLEKGYFMNKGDISFIESRFNYSLKHKKPIHLNIPYDVLLEEVENIDYIANNNNSNNNSNNSNNNNYNLEITENNKKILNNINFKNKNALLLIGQGIYGTLSYNEMLKINNILSNCNIPIITTYPSRGVVNENNSSIVLGLVGGRGTENANKSILNCDIIYSVGASYPPSYNTIPLKIRDKVLKKIINIPININSLNDITLLVNKINENIKNNKNTNSNSINNIENKSKNKNKKYNFKLGDYSLKIKEILDNLPDDAIITTDAGNHTVFTSLLKTCVLPKNIISSHSMGTMGFGLPTSIGVKFGCIDNKINREVVSINGDGGFQMNIQELGTISEHNLKILIIVMKNNYLNIFGKIKNPDFNKIADGYNIDNVFIENIENIRENIKYYLKNNKPYLMVINCENEKLPKKHFN